MLENIKILLGIADNSKDKLLEVLINQCTDEVKQLTRQDLICYELSTTIQKMVVWQYNRLGTEGVTSESYSGNSYDYEADYPDTIMRVIRKYRKVIML